MRATRNRQRTLRSLFQRTHQFTRGETRVVRHGSFHKVPRCLLTGYFAAFPFIIFPHNIPISLCKYLFYNVHSIYAAGLGWANRDPKITSEMQIESIRVRVPSPVVGLVGVVFVVVSLVVGDVWRILIRVEGFVGGRSYPSIEMKVIMHVYGNFTKIYGRDWMERWTTAEPRSSVGEGSGPEGVFHGEGG
jgi:hypothetical protein